MQLRLKIFLLSHRDCGGFGHPRGAIPNAQARQAGTGLMEVIYLAAGSRDTSRVCATGESAIEPLLNANDTPVRQAQAMAILSRMEFGKDGYFFVY
jgi:two-component system NarL family sensor kinase